MPVRVRNLIQMDAALAVDDETSLGEHAAPSTAPAAFPTKAHNVRVAASPTNKCTVRALSQELERAVDARAAGRASPVESQKSTTASMALPAEPVDSLLAAETALGPLRHEAAVKYATNHETKLTDQECCQLVNDQDGAACDEQIAPLVSMMASLSLDQELPQFAYAVSLEATLVVALAQQDEFALAAFHLTPTALVFSELSELPALFAVDTSSKGDASEGFDAETLH